MFGMVLCEFNGHSQEDVSFGNKANIIETRSAARIKPVHYGVNYHKEPLEFSIVFGSEEPLDRFEMQAVANWLTGYQTYQWLTIDQPDLQDAQFRCLITELTPISYGWLTVAFEAKVTCDCPYAYSKRVFNEVIVSGTNHIINRSSTREYIKPTVTITPAPGVTSIKIINKTDNNRTSEFTNLPAVCNIEMNCESGVLRDTANGVNLYDKFNLVFPRLLQGDNEIQVIGNCTIMMSGRYLYNTAG